MGDSGALLLGFTLAAVSVQGLLKTAATVALVFPLLVLAVPILDTSFVVAKRLKYRRADLRAPTGTTCTTASSTSGSRSGGRRCYHLRVVRDPRRAALATRFIPFRAARRLAPGPTLVVAVFGLRRDRARPSTWSTCSRSSSSRTR